MDETKRAPDPWNLFTRTGTPEDMAGLDANIDIIADRLIDDLRRAEVVPVKRGGVKAEDVRFMAYALATYRTRRGKALTEHHLRLLAAALEIQRPSIAAGEMAGLPPVKKLDEFTAAAGIVSDEPAISDNRLAALVGVHRGSIAAWRKRDDFRALVRTRDILAGRLDDAARALAASWAEAYAPHRPKDGRPLGRHM